MAKFKNGVSYYTKGTMTVTAYFPEDEVTCFHCWLRDKDNIGRPFCRATSRELYYIQDGIHEDCPLQFEKQEKEGGSVESVSDAKGK